MNDTPRTNRFYASFADGECIPNQDEWLALCESLETELTAVTEQRDGLRSGIDYASDQLSKITEQRDRLAEALRSIKNELGVPQPEYPAPVANAVKIADEALQSLTPNNER